MANSKYAYVRAFEEATNHLLLPDCFTVVRVDGCAFHRMARVHEWRKPNDKRACDLMVRAAQSVMQRFSPDIAMAYGQSDEFSFLFRRKSHCFRRRVNKLTSIVPSLFSAAFVRHWKHFFPDCELRVDPCFDARTILLPTSLALRDYLSWRQVDCHVNNLYNSTFHALTGEFVRHVYDESSGDVTTSPLTLTHSPDAPPPLTLSPQEATQRLSGTLSSDKHELLFKQFGINYNNELQQFRKGSLLLLTQQQVDKNQRLSRSHSPRQPHDPLSPDKTCDTRLLHLDIIKPDFWTQHAYLLDYLEGNKT